MMLPAVHRRQFLKLAGVAAVGVAFSERSLFAAAASGIVPLLGVGYAASLPANGFTVPMTDASSILSPDPTFISRAARVTVVGASRAKQHGESAGGIGVDAYFPITGREAGKYPRFAFWSAANDSMTGAVSFRMPALATTGLSFVVRRIRPTVGTSESNTVPSLETETSPLTLALGNVEGPKLARGVYALAFREENGDSAPSWSRTLLMNQNGKYSLSGAGVTYLLIEVDYDNEQSAIAPAAPSRNRASRH
ncbi:MAG: hypothetical protein QOC81_1185 [Thermoanaerobaculia bacterium]|jgi:hypothetical protein|nr:hypothetical protein [Thermoanaerobaculia bacterium]